jgi:hypothetical protein
VLQFWQIYIQNKNLKKFHSKIIKIFESFAFSEINDDKT